VKKKSGADLRARFEKLSEIITTEAEKSLAGIAVIVQQEAKSLAPKHTGTLAESIGIRIRYDGTTPRAVIGTNVKYATYIEFARDIKGHAFMPDVPTARFLNKAMDNKREAVIEAVKMAIQKGVAKCGEGVEA